MLDPMAPCEYPAEAVRKQLGRVLASQGFARNERLSQFLRLVVERHLEGRDSDLKESVIGVEVFGRKPGFDPKQDSTVRSEAGRLRARLLQFYAGEGSGDTVIIELPKGGYTPAFRSLGAGEEGNTRSRWPWLVGVVAAFAVVVAAAGWWWVQHQSAPIAIAVLPLTNLSQDPGNDYFSDGLTDEIIRNLSIIDGLAVRSQTSSFFFKGKPRNVREAGEQLQADYILEGSVLRSGQQLRINAQLVRVRDDFPLWSGRFDRELTDVLAIQDEISRGIVNSLRLKLGRGRRRYETSTEAYDLYLRARALGHSLQSIGPFKEAIAKDPSFAPAYAGLAATYAYRSGHSAADQADLGVKMRSAAEKAIQLDPLLAEANDALAIAYARDGQWEQSEKSFRRTIELDPSRSESYDDLALYLLLPLGRIGEAVRQMHIAEKADPLSPEVHMVTGYVLLSAGRYDEAVGHCEKLPADSPDRAECLGRALVGQGRIGEAIPILATAPNPRYLGYAYGRAGRREEAEKIASASPDARLLQALIFAGLGDKERTLQALERLATLGPVRLGRDLTYPEFAFVRGDPRVKALRKKVGLPE
jgi:TolB-like protein/cytochrome c-type biogenesis protein CcmH/NrfG